MPPPGPLRHSVIAGGKDAPNRVLPILLLRRGGIGPDGLLNLILRGLVVPGLSLATEIGAIQHLMKTYRDLPMSLADACLVRMAEIHENARVMKPAWRAVVISLFFAIGSGGRTA